MIPSSMVSMENLRALKITNRSVIDEEEKRDNNNNNMSEDGDYNKHKWPLQTHRWQKQQAQSSSLHQKARMCTQLPQTSKCLLNSIEGDDINRPKDGNN